jgi:hypothetical protein
MKGKAIIGFHRKRDAAMRATRLTALPVMRTPRTHAGPKPLVQAPELGSNHRGFCSANSERTYVVRPLLPILLSSLVFGTMNGAATMGSCPSISQCCWPGRLCKTTQATAASFPPSTLLFCPSSDHHHYTRRLFCYNLRLANSGMGY